MKKDAPSPEKAPKQPKKADAAVTPPPTTPKKKSKKWLIAGVSVVAALVIGLGAAGAAYFMQQNSPNRIIADSLLNAMTMPNQKNDGKVTVKTKDSEIELTVQAVARDTVQSGTAKVLIKVPEQPAFELTARTYQKDHENIYVKFDNPEKLAGLLPDEAFYGPLIDTAVEAIGDKWLRIETKAGDASYECTYQIAQKLRRHNTNESKALRKALHDHQFITHDESVKLENKGASRGYQVKFNTEVAKQFIDALEKDETAKEVADCVKKLKVDFESAIKQYKTTQSKDAKKSKAEVTDVTAQLWIDPANRRVTDVKLQAALKSKDEKGQDEKADIAAEAKIEYGDFDTAAEPAKDATVSIEEFMQAVVLGAFSQDEALQDDVEL